MFRIKISRRKFLYFWKREEDTLKWLSSIFADKLQLIYVNPNKPELTAQKLIIVKYYQPSGGGGSVGRTQASVEPKKPMSFVLPSSDLLMQRVPIDFDEVHQSQISEEGEATRTFDNNER